MEHYKISKLLNNSTVSTFVTRKWIQVNDLFGDKYSANMNIRLKTPLPRSDLSGYSNGYVVVKERISVAGTNNANKKIRN